MARKTRRPKVVWLPVDREARLGVAPAPATSGSVSATGIAFFQATGPIGAQVTEVHAVVGDSSPNLGLSGSVVESLADVTQSAYRLRRVVGKIFVCTRQDPNLNVETLPQSALVTCGLIVLRTNPVDSLPLLNAAAYDAQSIDNIRDPWIWRRTWGVTNVDAFDALPLGAAQRAFRFERSNTLAGSALDGPHVDAKTARVIGDEERLFLVITAVALGGNGQGLMDLSVMWDLRILASMRSSQGNRGNASR